MNPNQRFILLLSVVALSVGWIVLSKSPGSQKVEYTPAQKRCLAGQAAVPWRVCIYSATGGDDGGLVYAFHGRNLNEQSWNDSSYYTAMIQRQWAQTGVRPPRVAVVSFGPVWLLTSGERGGLLDVFFNEVMPTTEGAVKPTYRMLLGESMGGVNALVAGMSAKPGVFKRVVSLCPVVYRESPFGGIGRLWDFVRRTGADPQLVFGLLWLSRKNFSGEEEWNRYSPVQMIERVDPQSAPEFYVSAGLYDKYGNYEGAEWFSRRARERGLQLKWQPIYGGHCAIDIASVAGALIGS